MLAVNASEAGLQPVPTFQTEIVIYNGSVMDHTLLDSEADMSISGPSITNAWVIM